MAKISICILTLCTLSLLFIQAEAKFFPMQTFTGNHPGYFSIGTVSVGATLKV